MAQIDYNDQGDPETDEERELRMLRLQSNTAADDRTMAMRVLREIVDSPTAKAQDRKAAADSLLKAINEASGSVDDVELQGYDLTDEQLLAVIRDAQAARGANVPRETSLTLLATGGELLPQSPHNSPLMAALAALPDVDILCQ